MAHLKKRGGHLLRVGTAGSGHLVRSCQIILPNCCLQGPVISATLSGATGCAVGINATFALTLFSSCVYVYDSGELTPVDPCGAPCYTDVDPSFGHTRYWAPARYAITVTLSNSDQSIEVVAAVNYTLFRITVDGCVIDGGSNIPRKGAVSTFRRTTCQFGTLVRDGGAPSGIPSGLPPSDCTIEF